MIFFFFLPEFHVYGKFMIAWIIFQADRSCGSILKTFYGVL